MKRLPRVLPWLGTVCCFLAAASTPVPPELWAIRESAGAPPCGAVIVSESANYGEHFSDFDLTIRIYNEAGRAAAEVAPFPPYTVTVKGRTVYPDGREVPINSDQDLAYKSVKDGFSETGRTVLVPPGVTGDCVVELHWRVSGTYLMKTILERGVLGPYPIKSWRFALPIANPMRMAALNADGLRMEKGADGARSTNYYQFNDLPVWEGAPYAFDALDPWPVLCAFNQPAGMPTDMAREAPETYWKEVGPRYLKKLFGELRTGSSYRKLLEELRKDLPADPAARARELLSRVEEKVLNVSSLTPSEQARRTPAENAARIYPQDLDQTSERRWTTDMGITWLDYRLLQDCQLHPVLLYVADRRTRRFQPTVPTIAQFDGFLLGVHTSDGQGYAWFSTGKRFFPVGVIGEQVQGVPGLLVDPETWSTQPYGVPVQPATLNRRAYDFDLTLEEDADLFKVQARFAGIPEYLERVKFLDLETAEQSQKLTEDLEQASMDLSVTTATVNNVTSVRGDLNWAAGGTRSAPAGNHRQVVPFPGMPVPLWLPPSWPQKRNRTIVLPECQATRAVSRFKVPAGWKLDYLPEIHKQNAFGTVDWSVKRIEDGGGTVAEVTYQVVVDRMQAPPEDYPSFLAFMSWLERGWRMQIELEKTL